jgi:predicted porin
MKKHLIAAAVAGALAVPAMAQVSISGRLDVGYTSVDAEDSTKDVKGVAYNSDTSSRITFKASEDLGGGLKAGLFLESQISGNAKEGNLGQSTSFGSFGRGQYLTLSGGFGQILVGFANSTAKRTFEGFGSASDTTNVTGKLPNLLANGDSRNHQITYSTPKMAGFSVDLEGRATEIGDNDKGSGYGVAANYAGGPVKVRASYDEEANDAEFDTNRMGAAIALSLGPVTLHGLYADLEKEGATKQTEEGYEVGVSTKLGAVRLHASMAKNEVKTGATSIDEDGFNVGARYSLSKRTSAYLIAGQTDADGANKKVTQTAIGIVHKF